MLFIEDFNTAAYQYLAGYPRQVLDKE